MKIIYCIAFCLLTGTICHSQILKKVLKDAKNEAESKVRSKARQKTSDALDSLLTPSREEGKKSKQKQPSSQPSGSAGASSNGGGEGSTMGEGFISMYVSSNQVFKGGMILVTGTSVKYGELKNVELRVKGPDTDETDMITLNQNGTYTVGWTAEQTGEFTLTVKSSDGKDQKSDKVVVYDIEVIDSLLVMENIEWTHKTYDKLKEEADRVKTQIGDRDDAELEKKLNVTKKNVDAVLKLFTEIQKAAGGLEKTLKKGAPLPPNLANNLSQLNDRLKEQAKQMKQVYESTSRQPYDNTICEYLVMLNEACAAFSTFTNVWSKSVATILKNVVLDKATPKAVEMANEKAGANMGDYGAADKAAGKLFATAQLDAEGLYGKLSAASFTGDIAQFATDVLMKKYCGLFKGELSHKYTIIYRNSTNVIWWQYSYTTKAAVTFRYPKSSSGNIIRMKGNIEGNATSFRFSEDIEQEDEFREKMKSRARLYHVPIIQPVSVPFSTAQQDGLGFGAVARGVGTPAYFNIPVDAEYNTDAETIKLSLNEAIVDFSPLVKYTYGFVAIIYGVAPLVTRVDFPINKAKLTLNAVVSRNNLLTVTKSGANNLVVKGDGERHIGSESDAIEHKISYTLTARNDN
ncbi:MAG TPA: hypothetical protein VF476_11130 [Chitinophagaceae bacterium]